MVRLQNRSAEFRAHSAYSLTLARAFGFVFLTSCVDRVYNQDSQENAYVSFLKVPSVRGKLTNNSGIKTSELELKAFWDCDFTKNAVIFKAPGDCGSQEVDVSLNEFGEYTTPAFVKFRMSLNPTRTDAIQTVRFVIGAKGSPKLSASDAITSNFTSGEKISFRTDAGVSHVLSSGLPRRVSDVDAAREILSEISVYKLKQQKMSIEFESESSYREFLKKSSNLELRLQIRFPEVPEPFGTITQSLKINELGLKEDSLERTKQTITFPESLLLLPGTLAPNPTVEWKLFIDKNSEAKGKEQWNNLHLALQMKQAP